MDKFKISDYSEIELEATGKKTTMYWKGPIDSIIMNNVLQEYLVDFHNKCKVQGIAELDVNFYQVEYMNTMGIKNVIRWLGVISRENQYKVTIFFDSAISWQDVTFETFRKLIKNVEFKGK